MRAAAFLVFLFAAAPALAQQGRVYAPGPFDRLALDGAVEVRLSQGDRDQVSVAGDEGAQEAVEIHLRDGRLVIHDSGSWKFWNKSRPKVDVQVRNLSRLVISGASDVHAAGPFKVGSLGVNISGSGLVRFDALNAEQLRFMISGAGEGQLAGQVGELRLIVSGKGKVQADQLRATRASVSISGVGNAQLWVSDSLKMDVSGVGTIDYWGQPQVARSTSGFATISARGEKR